MGARQADGGLGIGARDSNPEKAANEGHVGVFGGVQGLGFGGGEAREASGRVCGGVDWCGVRLSKLFGGLFNVLLL